MNEIKDNRGRSAILFEIAEAEKEAFSDLTEANIDKQMAIEVDGEILEAPFINDRLPGQGILESSAPEGYSPEELERLLGLLQPREG